MRRCKDMRKSHLIFTVVCVVMLSFVSFVLSSFLLYAPCFHYDSDEDNKLSRYFSAITQEPAFSQTTAEINEQYLKDADFDYGEVVRELSKYRYTALEYDDALKILETDSLDENAYQVGFYVYSYCADVLDVQNIVWFEYESNIYALNFYYVDDGNNVYEYRTLYKTDMTQFPEAFSYDIFENHNLIEKMFSNAETAVTVRAIRIAAVVAVVSFAVPMTVVMIKRRNW